MIGLAHSRNLLFQEKHLDAPDIFSYLDGCSLPDVRISDGISSHVERVRLIFANLRRRWDIGLSIEGRVYTGAVRSTFLCCSDNWQFRTDLPRSSVFEYLSSNYW